jgi:hypothetical protein
MAEELITDSLLNFLFQRLKKEEWDSSPRSRECANAFNARRPSSSAVTRDFPAMTRRLK